MSSGLNELTSGLHDLVRRLENAPATEPLEEDPRRKLVSALRYMIEHMQEYDKLTAFTSRQTATENLLLLLKMGNNSNIAAWPLLRAIVPLVREKTLRTARLSRPEQDLLDLYSPRNTALPASERETSEYITFMLPRDILIYDSTNVMDEMKRTHLTLTQLNAGVETSVSAARDIAESVVKWSGELTSWDRKVKDLSEALRGYQKSYNFVGLAQAFKNMLDRKRREKWVVLSLMWIFGAIALVPILSQFGPNSWPLKVTWELSDWTKMLPIAAIEVLLVYFFRIFLINFYAVSDQMLQLEFRWSLCAFVESYVDFAVGKNSITVDERLQRFEAVIFGPLGPSAKDAPNVTDVLQAIGDLLKKAKPKTDG